MSVDGIMGKHQIYHKKFPFSSTTVGFLPLFFVVVFFNHNQGHIIQKKTVDFMLYIGVSKY